MDPRRPSRVIDPKVRKVGFFTPGPPPDRTQSGPATQSPISNSLSPVMIPPARHASDNLSRAVGVPVPSTSSVYPPIDTLQGGSFPTESGFSTSPNRSPSSRIGLDGEFSEDSANWIKPSNSGRFAAANLTQSVDGGKFINLKLRF